MENLTVMGVEVVMNVEEVTEVTPELIEAFARLTRQLSQSASPPTQEELQQIANSDATRLLVARIDGVIA